MPAPDRARLERLLGGEALADLRRRLRKRYRTGAPPADAFTLGQLASVEADALAGLLGRSRKSRASIRLSHVELDAALAGAGLADSLRAALEALDGPITDTDAERAQREHAWNNTFGQARDRRLIRALADAASRGLVKRLTKGDIERARRLINDADQVLAQLPEQGIALARLAAHSLGDAHALDKGRPAATLVLRALANEDSATRPRELWAKQGVLVNELAKPVATLNLGVEGDAPGSRLVATAGAAGEPLHLSLRLLHRHAPAWRPGQRIFVCENPEVLAAAADALGPGCPPMISIDGQLSAAPRILLDQLSEAGARFYYHGDFDWGGVRIANHFFDRYGAMPWRYDADHYRPVNGPPLKGKPVRAKWDEALMERMREAAIAIHEESQLFGLIEDLVCPSTTVFRE